MNIYDVIQILQDYQRIVTPSRIKFLVTFSGILKAFHLETDALDTFIRILQTFDPNKPLGILYWLTRHPLILRLIER